MANTMNIQPISLFYELTNLKKSQESLAINVDKLCDKLEFILKPSNPSESETQAKAQQQSSLLSDDIKEITYKCQTIYVKINDLIERIDD